MITETNLKTCEFSRDELFSVVVIENAQLAGELKRNNTAQNLTSQEVLNRHGNDGNITAWYYYANQYPVFMFANNEWREHHNFKENLIIISFDDLEPKHSFLRPFMGFYLDLDFIMVNQFIFTFRR